MKADLPIQDPSEVREAQHARRQKLSEKKEESRSLLSGGGQPAANRPPAEKTKPIVSEKVFGRNDRVTVQYMDGSLKKDVKFKTVEADINSNKCVLIEE